MRVLHVLNRAGYGGAETHAITLMKSQQAAGHDVFYAGCCNGWLASACRESGITVLPFRKLRLNDICSFIKFRRYLVRYGIDVIHQHSPVKREKYGRFIEGFRRCPVVIRTAHEEDAGRNIGRCRHIIAVSQAVCPDLFVHGYAADKISVIYHGVPDNSPANIRNLLRHELDIPDDIFAVVHVGRFSFEKGQDLLLQASKQCPSQMHFYLIGDYQTPFGQQILTEACGQSRIHFLGYRSDAQRMLPAFDAYALPSRKEALGLSIIVASAASLPIVASQTGGIPEVIVAEQTGLIVPPEDPVALAKALMRFQTDTALSKRLGEKARERYLSRFTVDKMAQSTMNVYRQCLAQV